ncbi:hypothetical protein SFC88_12080 [Nocardioides sp. HM23]|uniref:hypothetical protein n=1 Tax=Nocardioides bizhenqiangii TaxID=3095076 RepID=UPI002ACAFAE1|nr:hypothetical protein [Nocardioides sp. HM23]MDZ5621575.1 hypothetical protein [Nocardioides sp. HM23]
MGLRPRSTSSIVAMLALVAGLTTVATSGTPAGADDGDGTSQATTTRLKPALQGLVVTQPQALSTVPYADFGSMKLPWNTVEKRPGVYDFSAVDQALGAHPGVQFRLRFMAGIHAPQWVKDDSGGCVLIEPNSPNGNTGCAPRFWTDSFHHDYVALMRAVAARYESDPQVVEVTNSECTTVYSEPFILGADNTSIDRLWRAGYTKQGHETCLRRSTSAMMSLFPTTRVSVAGHSKWQFIVQGPGGPDDGIYAASWEDERAMLNELSAAYGSRLVLDDHGLGPDDTVCPTPGQSRPTATSWYCYMSGLHASPAAYGWQFTLNGGSMAAAADAGVGMGACFLEYAAFQSLDVTKRRQVHDDLLTNCADAGTDPGTDPTLTNETAPQVTGTPELGQQLTADPGTWSAQPETVSYQWLRMGRPIFDATDPTYWVRPADAGRRITVRVTATHADYADGQATSAPLRVARLDTNTRARLPKKLWHSRRPKVVIAVTAEGAPAWGRVIVTSHGRRVGAARLHNGWVRLQVHRMKPGRHRLIARFPANAAMKYSRSAPMRVIIKR